MKFDVNAQWSHGKSSEKNELLSSFMNLDNELETIARKHNCDKSNVQICDKTLIPGHNYTTIYNSIFSPRRYDKLKILEIGMGNTPTNGYSMKLWLEYFPYAEIHIADHNPKNFECNFEYDKTRVTFHVLDQGNNKDLLQLKNKFGNNFFDYIIDDGSHIAVHQILSFQILFDTLKLNGSYFIEDIHDKNFYELSALFFRYTNSGFLLDEEVYVENFEISSFCFYRCLLQINKGFKITR